MGAQEEAQRIAKEEAERKEKEEADRIAKEEAEKKAKEEAEKKAKEEADRISKEEAEKKAKEEADMVAKEEAEKKAKEETTAEPILASGNEELDKGDEELFLADAFSSIMLSDALLEDAATTRLQCVVRGKQGRQKANALREEKQQKEKVEKAGNSLEKKQRRRQRKRQRRRQRRRQIELQRK